MASDRAPFTITRRLRFEAGHRIADHESHCKWLHGHSYKVFVTVEPKDGESLDGLGRVVDFGVMKKMQHWLDAHMDHTFILDMRDYAGREAFRAFNAQFGECKGQSVYLMDRPPTAENIARHLALDVFPRHVPQARVTSVTVHETENCYATYVVKEGADESTVARAIRAGREERETAAAC